MRAYIYERASCFFNAFSTDIRDLGLKYRWYVCYRFTVCRLLWINQILSEHVDLNIWANRDAGDGISFLWKRIGTLCIPYFTRKTSLWSSYIYYWISKLCEKGCVYVLLIRFMYNAFQWKYLRFTHRPNLSQLPGHLVFLWRRHLKHPSEGMWGWYLMKRYNGTGRLISLPS